MDKEQLEYKYLRLTVRQREVLSLFLSGDNDREISDRLKIQEATVRKHLSDICLRFADGATSVNRRDLIALFALYSPHLIGTSSTSVENIPRILGELPSTTSFYGRATELKQLEQWIVKDRVRFITLLGMGGIGFFRT